MSEFFAMGGYAAYVWPAYGVTTIVLCGILALSLKSMREREALVKSLRSSRDHRQPGETQSGEAAS